MLGALAVTGLVATLAPTSSAQEAEGGGAPRGAAPTLASAVGRYSADELLIAHGGPGNDTTTRAVAPFGTTGNATTTPATTPSAGTPIPQLQYPQARGRFADATFDRVLALRGFIAGGRIGYQLVPADAGATAPGARGIPTTNLGELGPSKLRATALAAGDLDLVPDDEEVHDEAVMVVETDDHKVSVVVADFHATPGSVKLTKLGTPLGTVGPAPAVDAPSSVATGVGDVDGDGRREVLVAYPRQGSRAAEVVLAILRYERDGAETSLRLLSGPTVVPLASAASTRSDDATLVQVPSLDLAVGDFSGRGWDEVALSGYAGGGASVAVAVLGFDARATTASDDVPFKASSLGVASLSSNVSAFNARAERGQLPAAAGPGAFQTDYRPRLASAFLGASATDPLSRHQLVVAYPSRDVVAGTGVLVQGFTPKANVLSVTKAPKGFNCGGGASCDLVVDVGPEAAVGASTTQIDPSDHSGNPPDSAPVPAISLAVGGFAGVLPGTQAPPPWGVAVGTYVGPAVGQDRTGSRVPAAAEVVIARPFANGGRIGLERAGRFDGQSNGFGTGGTASSSFANLVAFDRTGQSLFIGPAQVIKLNNVEQVDVLAAEPPKHLDFDPVKKRFENVSRSPRLAVLVTKSTEKEFKSTTTNSGDYTIGGSAEVGGSTTFSAGSALVGPHAKTELEAKLKLGYAFSREEKQSASVGGSYEATVQQDATGADVVSYVRRTITVYRYPIYGASATTPDEPARKFIEVAQPVSQSQSYTGSAPGLLGEGYQPTWQNGNLFSYPRVVAGGVDRPDQGSYVANVPQSPGASCDKTGVAGVGVPTVAQPPTEDQVAYLNYDVAPAGTGSELSYTSTSGAACDVSSTHKLTQELGFKVTALAEENVFLAKAEETAYLDLSFEAEESWSSLNTADVSASTTNRFAIDQKEALLLEGFPYTVATSYYFSRSGTQRVVHAVTIPPGKGYDTRYKRPDPALNLPEQTLLYQAATTTGEAPRPYFNNFAFRDQIRGFFVVHPDDPEVAPAERGAEFGRTPYAGEKASVQVRVYNYSVASDVRDLEVRFEAVPIEEDEESGEEEVGEPIDLGTTVVPAVCSRMVTEGCPASKGSAVDVLVTHDIDTTKLVPAEGAAQQEYRIYVTLDPNDKIKDETHELVDRYSNPPIYPDKTRIIDPRTGEDDVREAGQNNQGFGLLTIARDADAVTGGEAAAGAPAPSMRAGGEDLPMAFIDTDGAIRPKPVDVSLGDSALSAMVSPGDVRGDGGRIAVGQPSVFRVHLDTEEDTHLHHDVELFEGDPEDGGRLIGRGIARGVTADGGTTASIPWTPTTEGEHHLYARVLEHSGDLAAGNALADATFVAVPLDELGTGDGGDDDGVPVGLVVGGVAAVLAAGAALVAVRRRRPTAT